MAAPVFLSYTWEDLSEADALDLLLRLRGVPIWRDRRQMLFGTYNEDRVRDAIAKQCSGFALYYTDQVLDSWFITEVELDEMARRRSRGDGRFFAGALFRREVSIAAAAEELREATGVALGEALGSPVSDEDFDADLRRAANAILAAYLAHADPGQSPAIRVETRADIPVDDEALLHLGWSPPLQADGAEYGPEVWTRQLLPALEDCHRALDATNRARVLAVRGNLHLSAALALGFEFREPTGWTVEFEHPYGPARAERTEPDAGQWRMTREPGGSDADHRLVVCVHATKDVTNAMRAHCRDLPPARAELHVWPPGGPGKASVDAGSANALAAAIAEEIQTCRTRYGTSETHLYLACPWTLAGLLGWHLASSGRLVSHEADVERESYRVACELT